LVGGLPGAKFTVDAMELKAKLELDEVLANEGLVVMKEDESSE